MMIFCFAFNLESDLLQSIENRSKVRRKFEASDPQTEEILSAFGGILSADWRNPICKATSTKSHLNNVIYQIDLLERIMNWIQRMMRKTFKKFSFGVVKAEKQETYYRLYRVVPFLGASQQPHLVQLGSSSSAISAVPTNLVRF